MKKCEKCSTTLSSKTIFKSFWKGYKKFNCLNCHSVYEFNFKDRLIGGILVGISIFTTNLIMYIIEVEIVWKLIFGLSLLILFAVVLSFLILPLFTFQKEKAERQKF